MRLEQSPRPDQTLRVSTRLITSSTILHLSSDELERTVNQEQTDNPALEVTEERVCLFCGSPIYGSSCTLCGRLLQNTQALRAHEASTPSSPADLQWAQQQVFYDIDNYGFSEADDDADLDPLALISTGETLEESLLQQLETLITPDDALIAEQLVGNLNERGYLEMSVQEIAQLLHTSIERVEYVLTQLQTLEPLGIGARNLPECLLIQLRALTEQSEPHPLAYVLVDHYLDELARGQFRELARLLKVSEQEIREAYHYIRSSLHPFPAHTYLADSRYARLGSTTTYIHPDVIIRQGETNFEAELIEDKRYKFSSRSNYPNLSEQPSPASTSPDLQRYMHHHRDRAKFFIDCIERRWHILRRVAELIIEYQHDFLAKGIRYLHPLTRAEIASRLHLDEGTVSRATANKYALLPNGRLIPLADFFDGSLSIKDMLRELIQSEDSRHPFSDEELSRLLSAHNIPLARRTVTKYREEMGIGSSRERCL